MDNLVVYEQPLNERMRTFLRLEHLFKQTAYTLRGFSVWDSRATLNGLIDILEVLARGDLKTETLKELDRLNLALSRLRDMPGVDRMQLSSILTRLSHAHSELHATSGQLGQRLREHELLASLRQRGTITAGSCSFDLPAYHFWLQQDPERRIAQLEEWYEQLGVIQQPVELILGIIREAADAQDMQADKGFYQQSLDSQSPVQMLRVMLHSELGCYPEISAGKHRFSIRFVHPGINGRPTQAGETISFRLTCCSL